MLNQSDKLFLIDLDVEFRFSSEDTTRINLMVNRYKCYHGISHGR